MSDKSGAPRPPRSGSGLLLSGLAVGAILGAPVAAAAGISAAGTSAAESVTAVAGAMEAAESQTAAIRDQFAASFTAGAVTATTNVSGIICDP